MAALQRSAVFAPIVDFCRRSAASEKKNSVQNMGLRMPDLPGHSRHVL